MNPGSFATDFSFQVYLPAERRAQQCSLDSEDVDGAQPKPDTANIQSNDEQLDTEAVDGERSDVRNVGDTNSYSGDDDAVQKEQKSNDSDKVDRQSPQSGAEQEGEEEDEDSDDENLLIPAEGFTNRYMRALIIGNTMVEESSPQESSPQESSPQESSPSQESSPPQEWVSRMLIVRRMRDVRGVV